MKTRFWRLAYDDELLPDILNSTEIMFPDLKRWPLAKNNDRTNVMSSLLTGDFILLANFDRASEIGTVRGVGRISQNGEEELKVKRKKPIPSWSLTPDVPGGIQQWVNEAIFYFDSEPARRYKLVGLTCRLFEKA